MIDTGIRRSINWGVSDDLALAHRLADLADEISRGGFESRRYRVRAKADGSVVTDVDVQIEEVLSREISAERPGDGFVSEELGGEVDPSGERRQWVVDGIDGTGVFVEGGSTWGTLIALVEHGEVQVGIASSPGLERRWWAARDRGAWTRALGRPSADAEPIQLLVAAEHRQPRGTVLPPAGLLGGWRNDAVQVALDALDSADTAGHGPLLVAAGDIEASVHLWGGPWDHAAFVVLVEEAGGAFSDLWGGRRIDTATAIFTNGIVHESVRRRVQRAAPHSPEPP